MSSVNDKTEGCRASCKVTSPNLSVDFLIADKEYGGLINFIKKTAQPVKCQLVDFLYPLYVHLCLLLLKENRISDAQKFVAAYSKPFLKAKGYEKVIEDLGDLKSFQEARSHSYFKKFCESRYLMKTSKENLKLLKAYLEGAGCQTIGVILHLKFHFEIISKEGSAAKFQPSVHVPPTAEEEHCIDSSVKVKNVKRTLSQDGFPRKLVKELPENLEDFKEPNQNYNKQKESTEAIENFTKLDTQNEAKKILKNLTNVDTQNETTEILDRFTKSLNENAEKESINESALKQENFKNTPVKRNGKKVPNGFLRKPSNYLYTIQCEKENVCSVAINAKNSFLACGFQSSKICLWNLDPDVLNLEESGHNTIVSSSLFGTKHFLKGHDASVYGLAFTPSNDLLMSCSRDSTVRAWNLKNFKTVFTYSAVQNPVLDITVSDNGTYFATTSLNHAAWLWDFEHETPLRIFIGHSSVVDKVQFHPNGKFIATASADKTIRLWTVEDAHEVRTFSCHNARPSTITFAPNGKHLAAADESGCIKIWDIGSETLLSEITAHSSRITSLSYNRDSSFIASGGWDNVIKVWDAKYLADMSQSGKEEINTASLVSSCPIDFALQYANFCQEDILMSVATL